METNSNNVLAVESVDFTKIPLTSLSLKSRGILSRSLKQTKIFVSEEGFARDYRGLAHLAGLDQVDQTSIASENDPTATLLKLWCKKSESAATFQKLQHFLGQIDRYDAYDDVSDSLVEDAKSYLQNQQQLQTTTDNPPKSPSPTISFRSDANILTTDDVRNSRKGLPPQQYDAFVLFADDDIDFASELIEKMEQLYGFKLCVKERDLLAGASLEHDAILRLIAERCNRLIVIVSPAFVESDANKFFVAFAQALGLDQNSRKIIPCLYENCDLPPTLRYCFHLNYKRSGKLWNFWDKLRQSIETTTEEIEARQHTSMPRITITEVESSDSLPPTRKQLQIKDKPSNNVETPPIKVPRKRRDEKLSIRFDDTNSLNAIQDGYSSASSIDLYRSPGTPDSMKQQLQIMPPRPKMRNASSMIDLSTTSPTNSDVFLDMADNPLSNVSTKSSQNLAKKPKWYRKLLSPNSISNDINSTDVESKEKPKKRWFRKKLATFSS